MVRTRFVAAALIALGLLVACGEDEPGGAATTVDPTAATAAVEIADFRYAPPELDVAIGATVLWTNSDGFAHTVTADDESFDSGDIDADATFEHTFAEAGTFTYFCNIHNYMKATVVVGRTG